MSRMNHENNGCPCETCACNGWIFQQWNMLPRIMAPNQWILQTVPTSPVYFFFFLTSLLYYFLLKSWTTARDCCYIGFTHHRIHLSVPPAWSVPGMIPSQATPLGCPSPLTLLYARHLHFEGVKPTSAISSDFLFWLHVSVSFVLLPPGNSEVS